MLNTKIRRSAWTVRLFIALFIGLSVQFAFATPIFEAPDEPQHFSFVNRVANRWRLPNQLERNNGGAEQEGSQPPLFYITAAVIATPRRTSPAAPTTPVIRSRTTAASRA